MQNQTDVPDHMIADLARGQFGTLSRKQALAAGLSRAQINSRVANGRLAPVHPGVFAVNGAPLTRAALAVAARLYAGDDAWFSHATAARLHGFEPLITDRRFWVTVPVDVRRRSRPGVRLMRSRRISGFTSTAHGQPALSVPRTVVDLAAILDDSLLRRVLYDVIGRNLTATSDVLAAAEDFGGRPGVDLVQRAVKEFDPEFDSGLENEADDLFRSGGLIFTRQIEIEEDGILLAVIDFGDEDVKFGLEIDGARYHSSASAVAYDRERDRMLRRRGWQIERLVTDDVRRRPKSTLTHVSTLYERRCAEFRKRRAA